MRYRKVSTRIWADDRFMRLSTPQPNAQSLFLYLLTGPHTTCIPGVIVAGEASLAEALGWPMEGFREAFRELLAEGFEDGHTHPLVMADPKARLIFLPKAVIHNQPESPNVIKSWKIQWSEVPECELRALIWDILLDGLSSKSKALADEFKSSIEKPKPSAKPSMKPSGNPFSNPSPKPMANQEQEQEQEQEKNLALFAPQKVAVTTGFDEFAARVSAPESGVLAEAKPRRGRPPKDQSPEAEAERVAEKADGERWMDAARKLTGLTADELRWNTGAWMAFRKQRKSRGMEQLMRALEGLESDSFSKTAGLGWLVSDNGITKGLAKWNKGATGAHVSRVQHAVGTGDAFMRSMWGEE